MPGQWCAFKKTPGWMSQAGRSDRSNEHKRSTATNPKGPTMDPLTDTVLTAIAWMLLDTLIRRPWLMF